MDTESSPEPMTNSAKKYRNFKFDLEVIQKQCKFYSHFKTFYLRNLGDFRQDDLNLIYVLDFKKSKMSKQSSRRKLMK